MSSQAAGRRRSNIRQYSAEDQALNMISKEAEARLAAKRAARAEAREIRMKEIEKQQKNSDDTQDRIYELTNEHAAAKMRQQMSGSRRGSMESNDSADGKDMDFKAEVRELEEKYKAAMMTSAQLDNEKQSLVYQVELLKDQLEEQDEGYTELQREYKDKCREYELQKRDLKSLEHELSILKQQLELKDRLIQESGFVIMANDKGEAVLEKQSSSPSAPSSNGPLPTGAFLVSPETKEFLERAGDGTLGTSVVSNITDKSVVSCNSSSDKAFISPNEESSKSPIISSSEMSKEKGGTDGNKAVSTDSGDDVTFVEEVSDRAEEELHDNVDSKGGVAPKSMHVDVVLQSEIHSGGKELKSADEKYTESDSVKLTFPPECPSSLTISASNEEKCESESDDNDEFFDSVASPVVKTNPIALTHEGEGLTENIPKEIEIKIDNVTTTDSMTDESTEKVYESPGGVESYAENKVDAPINIEVHGLVSKEAKDNDETELTSHLDLEGVTESSSSDSKEINSNIDSEMIKFLSKEKSNESEEIHLVISDDRLESERIDKETIQREVQPEYQESCGAETGGEKVLTELFVEEPDKQNDLPHALLETHGNEASEDVEKTAEPSVDGNNKEKRDDHPLQGSEEYSGILSDNSKDNETNLVTGETSTELEICQTLVKDKPKTDDEDLMSGEGRDDEVKKSANPSPVAESIESGKSLEEIGNEEKPPTDNDDEKVDKFSEIEPSSPPENTADKNKTTETTEASVVDPSEHVSDKDISLEEPTAIKEERQCDDDDIVKDDSCTADMEESATEKDKSEPDVRDSSQGMKRFQDFKDRTTSFGGESQCSDGGILDDYDLDDINDILKESDDTTVQSDNAAEGIEKSNVQDDTLIAGESLGTKEQMDTLDALADDQTSDEPKAFASQEAQEEGAGKNEATASLENEMIPEDQSSVGAESMKKAESQDSLEPQDLEQALDMKMKVKSKKKSKRFSLFKKVFK